ncbi:MAG: hypothetical protein LW832_08030, partial [Parachlamydia sp.]|nr:hypothetical protein [Parachlamydia sp.]
MNLSSALPNDIYFQVLSHGPVNTLSYRVVCKEWKDFTPAFANNLLSFLPSFDSENSGLHPRYQKKIQEAPFSDECKRLKFLNGVIKAAFASVGCRYLLNCAFIYLPGQLVPLLKRLEIEQDAALKAIWPSLRTEIKATGETNFPKKSAAAMQIRNYILEEEAIHRIEKLSLNALQLKALPIEIYQLKNLSHLELKQNAFREVPHFHRPAPFYSLFSVEARSISVHPLLLQWIDLSENQISQLTVVSSFLHQKGTLVIGHNPLSFLGDHLNINDLASLRFSRDSQFGALPSLTQLSKKTLYHIQDLNDNHVECKQLLAIHSFQVHFCCTFPLSLCCQGFLELNAKKIKCIQKIELKEALFLNKKINLEKISLSKAVTQLIFDRFDAIKKQTEIEHYIYKLTFTIHERKCEKNEEGRLYKKLIASKFTTLLAEAVS